MSERIHWPHTMHQSELVSPFDRGQQRPIRMLLDTESFTGIPPNEAAALDALHDVGRVPDIEITESQPGELPYYVIHGPNANNWMDIDLLQNGEWLRRRMAGAWPRPADRWHVNS